MLLTSCQSVICLRALHLNVTSHGTFISKVKVKNILKLKKSQSRHIFAFCSLSGGAVGASCPSAFEWARVAGHCEVTAQPEREDKKSEVVFNRNCREEVEITLRCRQVRLTSDVFW